MKTNKTELDTVQIERCAKFFSTLLHPMRIKIVEILSKGPKCVGDIQKVLKIDQPPTSHHLKLLVKIGVLNHRRSGKNTYYSLVSGIIEKTNTLMDLFEKK